MSPKGGDGAAAAAAVGRDVPNTNPWGFDSIGNSVESLPLGAWILAKTFTDRT